MIGVTKAQIYQLEITTISKQEAKNAENVATSISVEPTLSLWHRQMAHLNHAMIKKVASTSMVIGLILKNKNPEFYIGCTYGKNQRAQFPWSDPKKRSQFL
jgi:hypothetical protein